MRSFKTAVAHYPSTSVATHTATTTTHLRCVTKIAKITKKQSFLGRNGVPHLDGTTRRRTSVASQNRRNDCFQQRNVCYQQRNKTTHLRCITKNEPTHLHCVTKIAKITKKQSFPTKERLLPTTSDETAFCTSTERHDDAPPLCHDKTTNGIPHLDGTAQRRTSVVSRKHETKRRTSVASRRSVRTYKRNGVCTSIATPRT